MTQTIIDLSSCYPQQCYNISGNVINSKLGSSVSGWQLNSSAYVSLLTGQPYVVNGGTGNVIGANYIQSAFIYQYGPIGSSYFGFSIKGIKDFNSDGYNDVIVGAPLTNSNGANSNGACYIYSNNALILTINGANANDQFGFSVSSGDVNGDGKEDVIIGAPYTTNNYGKVYVIYGSLSYTAVSPSVINLSTTLSSSIGIVINGQHYDDYTGFSVAGANVNGDAYSDIIIGRPGYSSNGLCSISGSNNLATITLSNSNCPGTGYNGQFGYSVSNAGDVNRDGKDDLIIGAPFSNSNTGNSYLWLGTSTFPNSVTQIPFSSSIADSKSGWSVSGAGDVNKDGWADFIIGAPYANSNKGQSYVIFGSKNPASIADISSLTSTQGFIISGENDNDESGSSVAGIMDFNGDGVDDIAIGAPSTSSFGYINGGAAYIIYGFIAPTAAPTFKPTIASTKNPTLSPTTSPTELLIVINGGAETGTTSGWTTSTAIWGISSTNHYSGSYSFSVISSSSSASVSMQQNIALTTGTYYTASFWAEATGGTSVTLSLSVAGNTIISESSIPSYWTMYSTEFLASSSSSTLKINGNVVTNQLYVDNIIVTPSATSAPTIAPTLIPTSPTEIPTFFPTRSPTTTPEPSSISTIKPTNVPSVNPTYTPTITPTNTPSLQPTVAPTQYLPVSCTVGICYGSSGNDQFNINTPPNSGVKIESGGGSDKFVILSANNGISITISQFTSSGIIDLQAYSSVTNFNQLKIAQYNPPVIVKVENDVITLADYTQYLNQENFIFSTSYGSDAPTKTPFYQTDAAKAVFGMVSFLSYGALTWVCSYPLDNWRVDDSGYLINNLNVKRSFIHTLVFKSCFYSTGVAYALKKMAQKTIIERISDTNNFNVESQHTDLTDPNFKLSSTNADDVASSENPLHEQTDSIESGSKRTSNIELHETSNVGIKPDVNPVERSTAKENKYSCVIMSIDAMMEPEHVRLQNEEFAKFGEDLFGYNFLTENRAITVVPKTKARASVADGPTEPTSTPNNVHSSASNNNLMIPLLTAQQIVEYIPIINYIAQSFNVTLPELLDNKPALITSHLLLGNAAAALLPYESLGHGIITSTIATSSYAIRLVSAGYLTEQRQEALAQDEPMSSFETLKYCGTSMLAYTLPSIAKCAVTKWFIPETECSFTGYDLSISASLAGADCYTMYKATSEPSIPTTANMVIPYMLDAIAFAITSQYVTLDMSNTAMVMQSVKQCMSVVSAVVATDYMSRVAMDMAQLEMKESYIDKAVTYVSDYIDNIYQAANNLGSCVVEGDDSMLGCFTTVSLAQEL